MKPARRYCPEPLGTVPVLQGQTEVYLALRAAFPRETTAFVGCIMRTRHKCMNFEVWKVDDLFVRVLGDQEFFAGGMMAVYASAPSLQELIGCIMRLPNVHAMAQTERTLRAELCGFTTNKFEWLNETDWACTILDGEARVAFVRFFAFPALYAVRPQGGQRQREIRNRAGVVRCLRAIRTTGRTLPKIHGVN